MWRDRVGTVVVVTAVTLAVTGMALAHPDLPVTVTLPLTATSAYENPGQGGPHGVVDEEPVVDLRHDEASNSLVFSFPDESGDFPDCLNAVVEVDADGTPTVVDGPEGCHVVSVVGPNGQDNHGAVVSAFVHSIKHVELDGVPRGQVVREVAHSDIGKNHTADDDDDGDGGVVEESNGHGPPDHAPAHGWRRSHGG